MKLDRATSILGIAAFTATGFLGMGVAQAERTDVLQPATVSAPHACEWSTHQQTGQCVKVQMPPQLRDTAGYISSFCPTSHPHPFLGILSGNPVWEDKTNTGSESIAFSSIRAVAAPNEEDPHLSHMGSGSWAPGYVTVATSSMHNPFDTNKAWFVTGWYECADMPAHG